jgi:hypothetical protein
MHHVMINMVRLTQKKAVNFFQFHSLGLTMYGVNTEHTIPTTLLERW